ncbi:MAG: HDOD domain-containing protein [Candidatus Hydrogenedens sp.]|nr:HDOD domain-containing protein [Candidatus Hydrogenedens sp.]
MNALRSQIIERLPEVKALPVSAIEVVRLCGNPEAGVSEIASAIERDPLLTAEVLRLANSAYFAVPGGIATVREASVRLGAEGLLRAAVAAGLSPLADMSIPGYDMPAGALLDHMRMVAVGTNILGCMQTAPVPSYAFTAGMLVDIGKLALGEIAADNVPDIHAACQAQPITFDAAERLVLGIDHAEAGALLLEAWGLPEPLTRVVRWHHRPKEAGFTDLALDLVHASDVISLSMGIGLGSDGLRYELCPEVLQRLNLNAPSAERATAEMLAERGRLRLDSDGKEGRLGL